MVLDVDNIFDTEKKGADEFFVQEAEEALRPRIVLKSVNESIINNTTLKDDDELFMSLSADTTYEFELVIGFITDNSTTPGIKITFTVPEESTGSFYIADYFGTTPVTVISAWDTKFVPTNFETTISGHESDGGNAVGTIVRGTVKTRIKTGNLQFQWAQDTIDAADATTVIIGSTLKVTKQ